MGNRIQGEGDYESARRFNQEEQDFVKRKLKRKPTEVDAETDIAATDINRAADVEDDQTLLADDAPTQVRRGEFKGVKQRIAKDE